MKYNILIQSNKFKKYYVDAIKEYEKRLSRYCKINLIICKNSTEIEKKLPTNSYYIQISSDSILLSSEELAGKINKYAIESNSNITFIINSSINNPNEIISITKMDMDVGLLITIIYEQIYRAYRIIHNEPYHK